METQKVSPKEMLSMIVKLQEQVNKLQEDFEDTQLSEDDIEALKKAEEEYKNGETISLEELEKELGIK
jgi:hypothetical protein